MGHLTSPQGCGSSGKQCQPGRPCHHKRSRQYELLAGHHQHRLIAAGIGTADAISRCTYGDESLFFSYRRNCHQNIADYGRHISAIGLN
jgi:copper oxidase (laccase) domain-containing protein